MNLFYRCALLGGISGGRGGRCSYYILVDNLFRPKGFFSDLETVIEKGGHCVEMSNARECVCCHDYTQITYRRDKQDAACVTQTTGFHVNCLDLDSLEASTYKFVMAEGPIDDLQPMHE